MSLRSVSASKDFIGDLKKTPLNKQISGNWKETTAKDTKKNGPLIEQLHLSELLVINVACKCV